MIPLRTVLLPLALAATALAHADLAFDSFGPGDEYEDGSGYTISTATSPAPSGYQSIAQGFTSLTSGDLLSVAFAAFYADGTNTLKVGFYADAGGDVGAELTSWMTNVPDQGIYTLNAPAGISLVAGARYWVGLIAQDDSWLAWNDSSPLLSGDVAANFDTEDGVFSGDRSAFRVETQPVPEPASSAALGLGALAMLRRRRD